MRLKTICIYILAWTMSVSAHASHCQDALIPDLRLLPAQPVITSPIDFLRTESGWTSGGGAGVRLDADNTWFAGNDSIQYCIKRNEHYPIDQETTERLVEESLQEWTKFFSKYGLDQKEFKQEGSYMNLSFADGQSRGINLNFVKTECEDNIDPHQSNKLVFLFGMSNPLLDTYQRFSPEVELGFAMRGPYDHKHIHNGGYVWVGAFSSDAKRIKHLILHELGHVFGMKHNSVFVMDEHAASDILKPHLKSEYFGRIESGAWKYRILPGEDIVMTADTGHIRPRRQQPGRHRVKACTDVDAVRGAKLPDFVRRSFFLRENHCYKIQFQTQNVLNDDLTPIELSLNDITSGRTIRMRGMFENSNQKPSDNLGPGIYSSYTNSGISSRIRPEVVKRIVLDEDTSILPARGHFRYLGLYFPARISKDKGALLEIFLPVTGRWWTIRNTHTGSRDSAR